MQPRPPEFTIHCYHLLVTRVQAAWYEGRPEVAWQHLVRDWPGVRAALLDQIACVRDELLQIRAHAALAMAKAVGSRGTIPGPSGKSLDRVALRRLADSDARRIARHRLPHCRPFAELISASGAQIDGDVVRATRLLRSAAEGFGLAGMALYREACNYHLLSSDSPEAHFHALEWFAQHRVVAPDRLVAALAPALTTTISSAVTPMPSAVAPRPA